MLRALSEIWVIEGPNYTRFSIFATVKIGFYHNFISLTCKCDKLDPSSPKCFDNDKSQEGGAGIYK